MTARERATQLFRDRFGGPAPLLVRAPGRVNLIGEHTDYNDGFVLPMAIDRDTCLALRPRQDQQVHVVSEGFGRALRVDLADLRRGPDGWGRYVEAMAWALQSAGHHLRGWDGAIASDVPVGAGLSSSAALELAVARAFSAVSGIDWEPAAMALLAQRAENDWVGVSCGVMDQLVIASGRAGHALLLDCRSMGTTHIPMPPHTVVVILDTMTRRELHRSAYNDRRSECRAAARGLNLASLRDATLDDVERGLELGDVSRRRARHVVTENRRTRLAAEAMAEGDTPRLGALMLESHRSLREDFEVSSPALDTMVEASMAVEGCHGARMTGGGFGGCALALVRSDRVDAFCSQVSAAYQGATGLRPGLHVCTASDGVGCQHA